MACNANGHDYHFFFDTYDEALCFVEKVKSFLRSSGCVSLLTLNAMTGTKTVNDIFGTSVKWRIEDLEGTDWCNPKQDGDIYMVVLPSKRPAEKEGLAMNIPELPPVSITVNAADFPEELFLKAIVEIIDFAARIKDRDILINIIYA